MDISDPGLLEDYAGAVTGIAHKAGVRILEIYHRGFDVHTKRDGSPVTTADRLAHELIIAELNRLSPGIPVLSEESPPAEFDDRHSWPHYWLIDPLDGTKEFISRFTRRIMIRLSRARSFIAVGLSSVRTIACSLWRITPMCRQRP